LRNVVANLKKKIFKRNKLKSPFTISYKKKLDKQIKEDIINLFIINISGTNYKKIERINDDKLIVKGSLFNWPFENSIMTLWVGFCKKAELVFKNNYILYSVDYTYGVVNLLLAILVGGIPALLFSLDINIYYYIMSFILGIGMLHIIFRLSLHRQVFINTLKLKNRFKGNYSWTEILENKTNQELKDIVRGNTTLTLEVQKMAKEEIDRRRNN